MRVREILKNYQQWWI
uniref:Truncated envelope glycoprotein n=1 Tax=Human immunodeficiency virus type 1 TaxID=11676 RepID=A0A0H3Y8U0_HV1|nr:truncated envelope glycoprotein [Human immunodeficiency virus 1]